MLPQQEIKLKKHKHRYCVSTVSPHGRILLRGTGPRSLAFIQALVHSCHKSIMNFTNGSDNYSRGQC